MEPIYAADLPLVPASHENPASPGVWKRVLAQKTDLLAGVVQMLNWAVMPRGKGFAPHYHEDMQEVFVILQGTAQITNGRDSFVLHRGDAVRIDPREAHQMENLGEEDVEYIALGISLGAGGRTMVLDSLPSAGE